MAISDKKDELIRFILGNTFYLPESGLVKELAKALKQLSVSNLYNLKLIIQLKIGKEE